MDTYPQELVRTHRLFDGRTITIRPIRPGDDAEEMRFLRTLSDESRYLRFHQWIISPSDSLMHFFTDIDYDRTWHSCALRPVRAETTWSVKRATWRIRMAPAATSGS